MKFNRLREKKFSIRYEFIHRECRPIPYHVVIMLSEFRMGIFNRQKDLMKRNDSQKNGKIELKILPDE